MTPSQFISTCTADAIAQAAAQLRAGSLVAFPTETVYGLGADATNASAVARIYDVKGRPQDHPLIVHIASMNDMDKWCSEIPTYAVALARDFWPGPMTLILKRSNLAQDFITGGQDTVGVRVPNHALALALLNAFSKIGGVGIAAPSANRFGQVSPTTAQAVQEEIGSYLQAHDQIMDGGASQVGVESTIIDCTHELPRILRPGAITEAMIIDSTGLSILENVDEVIRVSGSLENHYSPQAKVILNSNATAGQGFIAFADIQTPEGAIRLAAPREIDEYARLLYSALRSGDNQGLREIAVIQPDGEGLAVAIRDRLLRASRGR
ncbi:MAG: threonylcarbamoyl-AMP synthase [Actinobacteria bacterium]|uniref:Threonylcarbamoyl-AMP synthase n=1 Tax=freshwater metagenome TaxID=449393 RepID=A0A6J7PDA9_9ZZZZ|nr:threonylcarbamoyl-AMP synthase [Actinomycetota bacterium]